VNLEQIQIVACGTSWHAGLGKYLLEQVAGIPTQVQYAQFRYAPPPLTANTLVIGVTQSGETADTLAALTMENSVGQICPSISDYALPIELTVPLRLW